MSSFSERRLTRRRLKDALKPVEAREFIELSEEKKKEVEERMDLYFASPLEMFPVATNESLAGPVNAMLSAFEPLINFPRLYHNFFEADVIEKQFPDDEALRKRIRAYSRFYASFVNWQMFGKRLILISSFGIFYVTNKYPPLILATYGGKAGIVTTSVVAALAVFWLVNSIFYRYHRAFLSERSARLVQNMNVATQSLRNVYTELRNRPDQLETDYLNDGERWAQESHFLMRLLVWIAKRLEYIEKYTQIEIWRIRWARIIRDYVSIAVLFIISAFVIGWWLQLPLAKAWYMQQIGVALYVFMAVTSFVAWNAPLDIARDQLEQDSWVRFGDLRLDDLVGGQVARDKRRLVEYRDLNKNN